MEQREIDTLSGMITDFNMHLTGLEEKMQLLRERISILSQTLLKQNDRINKEVSELKKDISNIRDENFKLKEVIEHIALETSNFARKEDLVAIQRYLKILDPLNLTTEEDVRKIVLGLLKEREEEKIKIEN